MAIPGVILIGDRINPEGFKKTRALIESENFAGLQALAVRQKEAGAQYLDLTIGPRGYKDPQYLTKVIESVQSVVDIPMCFDYPDASVQEVCLKAYDPAKANGRKPLVNSLAETRPEILDLLKIRPFQVVLMASERLEDGVAKPNKLSSEVLDVAKRLSSKLKREHNFSPSDIFIDITIHSLVSDTEGLTKMALEAIRIIHDEPELKGSHIMGGLTNIGNMLPPVKFDGVTLRQKMENAFLTVAVPLGFDTIMGTPWNNFQFLAQDDPILLAFREVIELQGLSAMRRLRKLWAKNSAASASLSA